MLTTAGPVFSTRSVKSGKPATEAAEAAVATEVEGAAVARDGKKDRGKILMIRAEIIFPAEYITRDFIVDFILRGLYSIKFAISRLQTAVKQFATIINQKSFCSFRK